MCSMCLMGLHASCLTKSCGCNPVCDTNQTVSDLSPTSEDSEDTEEEEESRHGSRYEGRSSTGRGSTRRDATLKDQQSTGRKRAARLYPLNRESPCEWRNKANCGGGLKPILGCIAGKQEARHHGPDKSVSNNEEGNVHRICHACHNRWHAANNGDYDWNETRVNAHSPRPQTEEEQDQALQIHMTYVVTKNKRIKD